MGRTANDGRGRLGGRAKGTPNKPLAPLNEWISGILNRNRTYIEGVMKTPWTPEAMHLYAALTVAAAINDVTEAINGAMIEQEPNTAE